MSLTKRLIKCAAPCIWVFLLISSCGPQKTPGGSHLESSHAFVPLKIEVNNFSKFDNPMLAEELVNQLATSLNYYLQAPFSERTKVPSNQSAWLKLVDIFMNNTGRTNVASKNNLKIDVKGGIFGGNVMVNYSLKQKYYAVTLKFEDYQGNLYRFPFYLWINEETIVEIEGSMDLTVGLDILSVLPGDVGHSMVSGLGELFTINGTSSNKFEWYESLAPNKNNTLITHRFVLNTYTRKSWINHLLVPNRVSPRRLIKYETFYTCLVFDLGK